MIGEIPFKGTYSTLPATKKDIVGLILSNHSKDDRLRIDQSQGYFF